MLRSMSLQGKERNGDLDGLHRLLDILSDEVSLVNRAANKRRWLVRKGDDDMETEVFENEDGTMTTGGSEDVEKMAIPEAVKTAVVSAIEAAHGKALKLAARIKAANEDESVQGLPMPIAGEFKACATMLRAINSKYPSEKKKGDDEPTDEQTADGADDVEKAGDDMAPATKAKALQAAEQAAKRLESLLSKVKNAETGEAEGQPMLPADITGELESLAAAFDGAASAYPSPKAAKSEDDTEPTDSDEDDSDDETTETEKAAGTLKEAHAALGVVMAKIKPGQPIDEDSYQRLERLRAILDSMQSGGAPENDDADKAGVAKAGAKMAAKRRKRFQEALKALIGLFKEIMPASELEKMPHLMVKKSSDESDELREKLAKTEADLETVRSQLADMKAQPQDSQVATDVSMVVQNDDDDVSWPLDLNEEFRAR